MTTNLLEAEENGGDISLADILIQLAARKFLIGAVTFIFVIIGWVYGQIPPDQFQAKVSVHMENRNQGSALPKELVGSNFGSVAPTQMATERHIIRSRLIMGPVADEINYDWRIEPILFPIIGNWVARKNLPLSPGWFQPKYARAGDQINLGVLDVETNYIGKKALLTILNTEEFTVQLLNGDVIRGRIGDTVEVNPDFKLSIKSMRSAPGRQYYVWREHKRTSINRLISGVNIIERGGSAIVDFYFRSRNASQSVKIANSIVRVFQRQTLSRRSAEIDGSVAFITEQLNAVREETAQASVALTNFRKERDLKELTTSTQDLLSRAVLIETEIQELTFQEEQLTQYLTPNHPDFKAILDRKNRLEVRLRELGNEISRLPPLEQKLLALEQRLKRSSALEVQLTARTEQLGIVKAATVGNILVLEPAERAKLIGPNRDTPKLIFAFMGFLLSAGGVLGVNFLKRGIDDARELEELDLPLFATINKIRGLKSHDENSNLYALAKNNPQDLSVEALRGLRTGLQFSLSTATSKILMITSPTPSLGKSFVSYNLGIVSSQSEVKTLLIDADLRRGKLYKQFGLKRRHKGLSDYLAGNAKSTDVLLTDESCGLDFIASGSYPPNPADLLTSRAFEDLLNDAKEHYDLIIIDTPPVLAVSDPCIIAQKVGMSLMVVKHLETTKAEIINSQKVLSTVGVKLNGAILNQFDGSASKYGYYGIKYGHYGGYRYQYHTE